MAKPILVANWKNNPKSLSETKALLKQLAKNSRLYKRTSLFIAPPYTYFESVSDRIGTYAGLASQDIALPAQGTHTSLITPDILKSFGTRLSIIGHSERRALGETDELVAEKVKIAIRSGIIPVVCVGESERDQDGEYFEFLRNQIKASLASLSKKDISKLILAYEPVWAIGKTAKEAINSEDLSETVRFIKKILADIFGRASAEQIPILYGGSTEPNNAAALFKGTGIRGFLVGHSSLRAKEFKEIAKSILEK